MDYYKIGQQIRTFRRAKGLSQAELAEKINISVTHMSHIETGGTKLSLPVFVDIAAALDVRLDDLLDNPTPPTSSALYEISAVLGSCTDREAQIIADVVKTLKHSMDRNL